MQVLIYDDHAEYYAQALMAEVPGVTCHTAQTPEEAAARGAEVEVLIALAPRVSADLLAAMPRLKWVQALTTGVDNLTHLSGIALTNCHGIHGPQMSELAVLQMLALARDFPRVLDNQKRAEWVRWPQPLLANKTACLVGVGAIAEHLAGVLAAFGMRVTGVTSRLEVPGFARTFPRAQINDAVGEADFVVVLTPYSAATHHVIDARVLAAMKSSAYLVNLSRGGCVDEAEVIAALTTGEIAGAALDVFAREPLPGDDPLWSVPGLIVTPHLGGFADVYHEQALPIVAANLAEYLTGGVAALKNRMDR